MENLVVIVKRESTGILETGKRSLVVTVEHVARGGAHGSFIFKM